MLKTISGKAINLEKAKCIFLTSSSNETINARDYIKFPYKYHDEKSNFSLSSDNKNIIANRDMLVTVSFNIWGSSVQDGRVWIRLMKDGEGQANVIQYGSYNTLSCSPIILDLKKGDTIGVMAIDKFNLNTGSGFYSNLTITEI